MCLWLIKVTSTNSSILQTYCLCQSSFFFLWFMLSSQIKWAANLVRFSPVPNLDGDYILDCATFNMCYR